MALPIFRWLTSTVITSGKSLGRPRTLILNSTCSSTPPSVFTPSASPTVSTGTCTVTFSFSATSWKSTCSTLPRQRVVLDFLHQRQPLGPGIVLDRQVHQQVLGDRMVDQVFHFLGVDLEVLRLGLPAVNDGRDAAGGAECFGPGAPRQRAGSCVQ